MAKIGLPKGSGKWLKVREKSVKSQGILKWILNGNPENLSSGFLTNLYSNQSPQLQRLARKLEFRL